MNSSNLRPNDLFTLARPETLGGRVLQFPLVRLLVAIIFLFPVSMFHQAVSEYVMPSLDGPLKILVRNLDAALSIVAFLLAYKLYVRVVEKRLAREISLPGWFPEFLRGIGLAAVIILSTVSVVELFGGLTTQLSGTSPWVILYSVLPVTVAALVEEIVFRGILFKLTEEWLGSWMAVVLQALLFGFAHGGNQNATLWSNISIAISGGLLLALAYMATRRLWLAVGIHIGWNFFQSRILGLPNSGELEDGLLRTALSGPEWLTGGVFGIEASVVTPIVCILLSFFFLKKILADGGIVVSSWTRKKAVHELTTNRYSNRYRSVGFKSHKKSALSQ